MSTISLAVEMGTVDVACMGTRWDAGETAGKHVKEDKADGWVGWVAGHLDCLAQELGWNSIGFLNVEWIRVAF